MPWSKKRERYQRDPDDTGEIPTPKHIRKKFPDPWAPPPYDKTENQMKERKKRWDPKKREDKRRDKELRKRFGI